jgi:hypothetical protein
MSDSAADVEALEQLHIPEHDAAVEMPAKRPRHAAHPTA